MADSEQACAGNCCDELVNRYEQMRLQALEEQWTSCEWGMALFVRSGMAAWINAWSQYGPQTASLETERPRCEVHIPAGIQSVLMTEVANMVLNAKEVQR